jgi:hypothetical protein
MTRGRPPLGAAIVDRLEGSPQAKHRLRIILRTFSGEITALQACQELGIGETRFHDLRNEVLQYTLQALEPKPVGRPPLQVGPQDAQVAQLQQDVEDLRISLQAAQIRQELAAAMPHAIGHPDKARRRRGKKYR